MIEKEKGQIRVTVYDADRLSAITELAQAVKTLAMALNATTRVWITDCCFEGPKVGVSIDTEMQTAETETATWEGTLNEPQSSTAD